jgi:NADH-quinone oxidoreductase subunit F
MAGWELGKRGYETTIFESESIPGGMLSWAIPDYRLPKDVLNLEIEAIRKVGVEIKTNTKVGQDITFDEIFDQGYKAVFIATGAPNNISLGIPGEDCSGVIDPIQFLKTYILTGKAEVGKKVAVVGGGNTAIDAARTAWRLGAEVTILYRRTRPEMPAIGEEIAEAIKEGIKIEYLTLPIKATSKNGRLSKITCTRMELADFDRSGRRKPTALKGSEFELEVDTLIPAIGQKPDLAFLNGKTKLNITKWSTLEVDPDTMTTNVPGVFAGGDVVSGPATVLEAMQAGKIAAESIHRYIEGLPLSREYKATETSLEVPPFEMDPEQEEALDRPEVSRLGVDQRRGNFQEVEQGLSEDQAVWEARRCLRCDLESSRLKGG